MFNTIAVLSFIFLISCSEKAEIKTSVATTSVAGVRLEVSDLNEIGWPSSGRRWIGDERYTQSIVFTVHLPELSPKATNYLFEKQGADSWVLRFTQINPKGSLYLGTVYAPFKAIKKYRGSTGSAQKSVGIKVYYAAAYPSERFRRFKCPAFGHDKRVAQMEIVGEIETMEIELVMPTPFTEKAEMSELTPTGFNGGHSLIGDYKVEIALYDSHQKRQMSRFKTLKQFARVEKEETIVIDECRGAHPEREAPR